MNCALWLNKQKVQQASEIPENLDVASLRGYFLAGSLVEWLCEHGGKTYAKKLANISADDPDLNQKLADIFGGRSVRSKRLRTVSEESSSARELEKKPQRVGLETSFRLPSSGLLGSANFGSGSFNYSQSALFRSFREFMLNFGTGSFGSYNIGSFSQWEWMFALFRQGYGSFMGYSGSFSSFYEWEWEWLFALFRQGYGSFMGYSGSFSSFHKWEWEWLMRLFGGSFSITSFRSFDMSFLNGFFGSFGSFNALAEPFPCLDEYDRIMLETLMRCPLDRFGYGVHNI